MYLFVYSKVQRANGYMEKRLAYIDMSAYMVSELDSMGACD